MASRIEHQVWECFLPQGVFEWFELTSAKQTQDEVHIILTEKNIPPLTNKHANKKIVSKGFKDITITDFPLRGRKTLLTFKRRRWKVEGQQELLKRDIKLCAPGTQLEQEFADFLKEQSGDVRELFDEYC